MNTDIRLSTGFWSHPKTRKLIKRLGLEGVRSLQILWLWAAQEKPDGSLAGMDWEDIELAADWQGEERAFFDHCLGVWIDEVEGGYVLHDWAAHNPWQVNADDRSDKARFSRLATVNRPEYDRLKAAGVNAISKDVYDRLTTVKRPHDESPTIFDDRSTTVDEPSTNRQRNVDASPTPAPAPAPNALRNTPPNPLAGEGGCDAVSLPCSENEPKTPAARNARASPPYTQAFEAFWRAYPRKVGKDAAFRVWKRKKHELPPPDELAAILARQCHCEQWQRDGGQYIPHPATWLNGGRWQDELEPSAGLAMADPEGW